MEKPNLKAKAQGIISQKKKHQSGDTQIGKLPENAQKMAAAKNYSPCRRVFADVSNSYGSMSNQNEQIYAGEKRSAHYSENSNPNLVKNEKQA